MHNSNSWTWIWKIAAPEKIKFFIWCACHNAIPTLSLLCRRNLAQSDIRPRCSTSEETILHCIRDCNTAQSIWNSLGFRSAEFFNPSDPEVWLRNNSSGNKAPIFLAGLWWNWRARN
ncbi:RNA-directed DNA polymerase (Reverse transcriptase), partial [Trifolium medium]|nr:RNA-directed DNA polymerase (Reverse transcriptase) [Trifolium medium]